MYCILCINGEEVMYCILCINGEEVMYCILCINGEEVMYCILCINGEEVIYCILCINGEEVMYCILMISFLSIYLLKGKKSTSGQSEDIRLSRKGKIKSCCKYMHVEQSLKHVKICYTCIIKPLKQIYSFSGLQCSKIIMILDFFDFGLC